MRVLIAPDKFKGSLCAAEAATALARGLRRVWPAVEISLAPIADGGEGTAEALLVALAGQWRTIPAHDAVGNPLEARYAWIPNRRLAILEMSETCGLWRIPPECRNPLRASTRGTGEMIAAASREDPALVIVGLGGSATTDGGAGMAAALGWRFLDADGTAFEPLPENLCALARLVPPPDFPAHHPRILAACDVQNPLLGPRGAARVFAPQKGASAAQVELLERALKRLAEVAAAELGRDFRNVPGAGAAGGLGFGLMTFCRAQVRSGFELVAELTDLKERVRGADLIVTGEGALDAQTLLGKGPAGLAQLARNQGRPVVAFAGRVEPAAGLATLFDAIECITPPNTPNDAALRCAAAFLESAAERFARSWGRSGHPVRRGSA